MKSMLSMLMLVAVMGCNGASGPTQLTGTILSLEGQPLAGATVGVSGNTVETDAAGGFVLSLSEGVHWPKLSADGYVPVIRRVEVHAGVSSELRTRLKAEDPPVAVDAQSGGSVLSVSGAGLEIGPDVFVDKNGNPVQGTMQVSLTRFDPSDPADAQAYPSLLRAISTDGGPVMLMSQGAVAANVRKDGELLQVKAGESLELSLPAPSAGQKPEVSWLWHLDEDSGEWQQVDGTFTLDPVTDRYQATVPHLSTWNCDTPYTPGCAKGRLVDQQRDPIPGAWLSVSQDEGASDWTDSSDANGRFCMWTPRDEVLTLTADRLGQTLSFRFQGPSQVADITKECDQQDDGVCVELGNVVFELQPPDQVIGWGNCDTSVNPWAGTCLAGMGEAFACFAPQGQCTMDLGGGGFGMNIEYANGARIEQGMPDPQNPSMQMLYINADGQTCLTFSMNVVGQIPQMQYTTNTGQVYLWQYYPDGTMIVTCPDGTRVQLSMDQEQAATGCGMSQSTQACGVKKGSLYAECDNGACEDGLECCPTESAGLCYGAGACDFMGDYCANDQDCFLRGQYDKRCCGTLLKECVPWAECD